jgi:hypothetical protein
LVPELSLAAHQTLQQGWAVKTTPGLILTVPVNTIILSEKWTILFFFISKMMKIFN